MLKNTSCVTCLTQTFSGSLMARWNLDGFKWAHDLPGRCLLQPCPHSGSTLWFPWACFCTLFPGAGKALPKTWLKHAYLSALSPPESWITSLPVNIYPTPTQPNTCLEAMTSIPAFLPYGVISVLRTKTYLTFLLQAPNGLFSIQ